ncbi:transcriptional regulator [Streptococcus chenjunshii]|uniref:Transcriptional regulator n=1 Tax=Streptococcus chenjunshii TaxID=2173853 RepID=A0A372KMP2_9STRE|nr:helix-turn-helix transcriptional regulator [Streptococcus chenjunshii]AXQ79552.1 transcriptional regulator [Streptococcus chenjunshii]RFU51467.1 transcriptional regulator [Streptococcus chenjunshii]RFU53552.1 transcriptional regulator [Streptococcus chenjunshii]
MANILTNLKELRKARKLSQQDLAQLVGVRRETIVHLENNRYNPSLELALKIAAVIQLPVEDIFRLNEDKDS